MPVALCVLGIFTVFQAMIASPKAPRRPESHRRATNAGGGTPTCSICNASPTAQTTERAMMAATISWINLISGASSIVGVFKYQWPRNMAAIVEPSNTPLVGASSHCSTAAAGDSAPEVDGGLASQAPMSDVIATITKSVIPARD